MTKEQYVSEYIKKTLNFVGASTLVDVTSSDDSISVKMVGDNLNFLIGFRGSSLNALQHLLAQALYNNFSEWTDVYIDINDYRERKKEKLEDMTKNAIDKIRFFSEEVHLPAMSSFERKMIHEFVSGYDDITTESIGEGPNRHIVVKPAAQN